MRIRSRVALELALATLALGTLACALPLRAMSYVQMQDADLIAQAHGVVSATVVGEPIPVFDAHGVRVAAQYTLDVSDDFGRDVPATVVLQIPGWQGGEGAAWRVPGIVELTSGDSVVVVYDKRADGVLRPLHLNLGVFVERVDAGRPVLARALEDLVDAAPGINSQFGSDRDPQRFKAYLRDRFAGIDAPVDYLVPTFDAGAVTPVGATPKFTSLTGGGVPVRWFQFDQGTTVNWRANSDGQTGMVRDEFSLLQTALAAWNNDATSNIRLGYAGTLAPGAADPVSPSARLKWNDPNNEIAGSFSCATGGVLAIAGPSWIQQSTAYRGTTYYTIQTGRMTTQDGAGCFFDGNNGANAALVFAHEIGHTLGFGHSCGDASSPSCASNSLLNDALMRASAHNDGRGASLRVDDIAAANQWYFAASAPVQSAIFANGFD